MGTSTLAVIVAIGIFVVALLRSLSKNKTNWKTVLKDTFNTGIIISVCAWVVLYLIAALTIVYRDHVFLVSANAQKQIVIANLQSENEQLKKANKAQTANLGESHKTTDTVSVQVKRERQVTAAQKITGIRHLMNFFANAHHNGSVSFRSLIGNDDALAFTFQLEDVFRSAGWAINHGEVSPRAWSAISELAPVGVVIATNRPDYDFLAVEDALAAVGVSAKTDIQGINVKRVDGIVVLVGAHE
jgi:hypothetical protein